MDYINLVPNSELCKKLGGYPLFENVDSNLIPKYTSNLIITKTGNDCMCFFKDVYVNCLCSTPAMIMCRFTEYIEHGPKDFIETHNGVIILFSILISFIFTLSFCNYENVTGSAIFIIFLSMGIAYLLLVLI